ncbi:MAG: Ppx/GppA family phosphatase [Candidatus Schekmanbacteria bacterium]|nr:MAG: Ppx/GppA family phosphatase [Candidatus Schekmanbacteria bacterium]
MDNCIEASIDLGTNSALLLIAKKNGKKLEVLREELRICRIGEGTNRSGILNDDAVNRTIKVLKEYKKIAEEYNASKIIVGATSALRDAKNSNTFIKKVKELLDINIQIISGEEEALLTYYSAIQTFPSNAHSALVVDIGGGSTEFIIGKGDKIKDLKSLRFGSVRLTEEFIKNNPPSEKEIENLKESIIKHLSVLHKDSWRGDCLIGIAGTVTTVAQMIKRQENYIRSEIEGFEIGINELTSLIDKIKSMTTEERMKLPGLHPARADVIVSGALILNEIMNYFGYDKALTSTGGVRYGLLLRENF